MGLWYYSKLGSSIHVESGFVFVRCEYRKQREITQIMKRNLLPVFAGIAALGLSLSTIPFALSQSNPGNTPAKPDKFSRLNLTPDQQSRIDALRSAERQQIESILTAEQRSQLGNNSQNGGYGRRMWKDLNLTDAQKQQIKQIKTSTKTQIDSILTAEQRQQLQQMKGGRGKLYQTLNLTSEQQARLKTIKDTTRQQIESVLTAEQKTQLEASKQNGQRGRGDKFASLNLTDAQRQQIEQIRTNAKAQMDAVLTPEQRQQLEQMRPQRPEGAPSGAGNPG